MTRISKSRKAKLIEYSTFDRDMGQNGTQNLILHMCCINYRANSTFPRKYAGRLFCDADVLRSSRFACLYVSSGWRIISIFKGKKGDLDMRRVKTAPLIVPQLRGRSHFRKILPDGPLCASFLPRNVCT